MLLTALLCRDSFTRYKGEENGRVENQRTAAGRGLTQSRSKLARPTAYRCDPGEDRSRRGSGCGNEKTRNCREGDSVFAHRVKREPDLRAVAAILEKRFRSPPSRKCKSPITPADETLFRVRKNLRKTAIPFQRHRPTGGLDAARPGKPAKSGKSRK